MTEPTTKSGAEEAAVRPVRTQTSRAGLRGSNKAAERLEKEAAARRALFVASIAGIVGAFGLIAASELPPAMADAEIPVAATEPGLGNRVLAEVPIGQIAEGGAHQTIIRIVAADPQPTPAHLRTRAS